jgi:hypothetical protein
MNAQLNIPPNLTVPTLFKAQQQGNVTSANNTSFADMLQSVQSPVATKAGQVCHIIAFFPYIKTVAGDTVAYGFWNGSEFIGSTTIDDSAQASGTMALYRSVTFANIGDSTTVNCSFNRTSGSGTITVARGLVLFIVV